MKTNINISHFISKYVTKRKESLLKDDLLKSHDKLINKINNKSVLVIGGAGSIGASYIKALLNFSPLKLVVIFKAINFCKSLGFDVNSFKFSLVNKFK